MLEAPSDGRAPDATKSDPLADFKVRTTIQIPNDPTLNPDGQLKTVDIGYWDQNRRLFFFSDRSNGGVDVIDTTSNRFLYRVGGFSGAADHDKSGPNGLVSVGGGRELWAANGDSAVKVIDVGTRKIVDSVSTGGVNRVDEIAYDPRDEILLAVNNEETATPEDPSSGVFATLISTKAGHKVLGKIVFHDAGGLEQAAWDPDSRRFYLSVPEIGEKPENGAIVAIDPLTAKITATYPVSECMGAGVAIGPRHQLLIGCSDDAIDEGFAPKTVIMNLKDGSIAATITEVGASDEVWYNPGDNRYYLGARGMPSGPVLGVIDAATNRWLGNKPTAKDAKSVAVDRFTNRVYVPLTPTTAAFANDPALGLACASGCVAVYGSGASSVRSKREVRHQHGRMP